MQNGQRLPECGIAIIHPKRESRTVQCFIPRFVVTVYNIVPGGEPERRNIRSPLFDSFSMQDGIFEFQLELNGFRSGFFR